MGVCRRCGERLGAITSEVITSAARKGALFDTPLRLGGRPEPVVLCGECSLVLASWILDGPAGPGKPAVPEPPIKVITR